MPQNQGGGYSEENETVENSQEAKEGGKVLP